jgi:hypothetical protein
MDAHHAEEGVSDEEEDDDEFRHLSRDERIAAIKQRARPEISRDEWARRRAHALDLDERLGPPLDNCVRVHAAKILEKVPFSDHI